MGREDEMDEPAEEEMTEGYRLQEEDNWAPGQPTSWDLAPTLIYQALDGTVFTTLRWPDGSVARGETTVQALKDLGADPLRNGFYDAMGSYLGESWVDEEAWAKSQEPTLR